MRNVAVAAALIAFALLALPLVRDWPEMLKYLSPTSATVSIPSSGTTVTAFEPLVTGPAVEGWERKAKVVLVQATKTFTAYLSSTGDLMPTPNIGVYIDGEGSVIVSSTWQAFRLRRDAVDLELLPLTVGNNIDPRAATPGVVDIDRAALQRATALNPALCAPMGLTPSLYLADACFLGSFNFDGASQHRSGDNWNSSKWHYATAVERAEYFELTGG
jgi:hypothetical protein